MTGPGQADPVPAAAQQGYAGGSFGQFKEDVTGETATGFKLFGGYQVNKNFAAEAAYVSTGTAKINGLEFKATGFTLAGVGTILVNRKPAAAYQTMSTGCVRPAIVKAAVLSPRCANSKPA